jgi:2-polyprenyl-3-methyl-5-hydroxy-6-metoxy-1,4-benzoquinol methylase
LESIGCIFCHNNEADAEPVIEEKGFIGRRCPECGLIFVSPRPDLEATFNLYEQEVAHSYAGRHQRKAFGDRLIARHTLSIIKRFKTEGSLLEIGAGGGMFLEEARKAGFEVSGVELNPFEAEFIIGTLNILCAPEPLSQAYPEKKFDVIYHRDVLSHFHDPIEEFRHFNDRLNPDGIVVFETGNFTDVQKRFYGLYKTFHLPEHLFFFGRETFKRLLESTGFMMEHISGYSILYLLTIDRFIEKLLRGIQPRPKHLNGDQESNSNADPINESSSSDKRLTDMVFRIATKVRQSISYVLVYKIGRFYAFPGHPHTMIVVARKMPQTD